MEILNIDSLSILLKPLSEFLTFYFQNDLVSICINHHQVLHTDFMELSPLSQVNTLYYYNPYLMNGFSHSYHLSQATFVFRGLKNDFYFLSHFSLKFLFANRIAPDGMPGHIWGYAVCLCPTKRMPGLNELIIFRFHIG